MLVLNSTGLKILFPLFGTFYPDLIIWKSSILPSRLCPRALFVLMTQLFECPVNTVSMISTELDPEGNVKVRRAADTASAIKEIIIILLKNEITSVEQYERMYNQAPIWAVQILNVKGVERKRKFITANSAKLTCLTCR